MYWAQFESAIQKGRLVKAVCNLADVLDEATRLSSTHTLIGGYRGFDILHVAAALHLGAREFLTFDANQKKLAQAEGLKSHYNEVRSLDTIFQSRFPRSVVRGPRIRHSFPTDTNGQSSGRHHPPPS